MATRYPTEYVAILETENPSIPVSEQHRILDLLICNCKISKCSVRKKNEITKRWAVQSNYTNLKSKHMYGKFL